MAAKKSTNDGRPKLRTSHHGAALGKAAPKAKKADAPQGRGATKPTARRTESAKAMAPPPVAPPVPDQGKSASAGMALTVRVEINLPAGGDQETYDRIFKSIRENLLNGSSD